MRVIVSGGGTGGHIYPALALIKEIKKREPQSEFMYIGTPNGLEADIVPKEDIPFQAIEITGFKRKLALDNVKTILRFLSGVRRSKKLIRFFKPDIVIGTGGYVCGPVVYAASKMNIPTLIHEQNVIPGLTNKFLSRYTSAVAVSFEGSLSYFKHKNIQVTGNPRATEVFEADGRKGRESLNIPLYKKVILIVGGSRGAKAINQAFMSLLDRVGQLKECHFIYVTGEVHYERLKSDIGPELPSNVTLKPFIYNMPEVLAGTDLIINRAGASFLAEITALGLPAVLIPSPYVTNNHQEKNARWLEKQGAAKVLLEGECTGESLWDTITFFLQNEEALEKMASSSKALGLPQASTDLYQFIKIVINDPKKKNE